MDVRRKLAILADAAKYDASCASSGGARKTQVGGLGNSEGMGICHSYTPDGRCVSLLKILLTNYCVYDCQYCVNRISSDTPRARFTPEEVANLTVEFYRRNLIEGLFLSSGILKDPDTTMVEMVRVARLLREEHKFGGYIHLKGSPGAAQELLTQAGRYADRLSINVELPTASDLRRLAPEKTMPVIEAGMGIIRSAIEAGGERSHRGRRELVAPAGQSTQMIVGASPASDRDILFTATHLYDQYRLRRVYYSAYSPIPHGDERLPSKSPPLVREHRLYEADWLVRFYGFDARELVSDEAPNLRLDVDPKLAWALANRHVFPVDVNRAPREMLLRVPGLGVKNVARIVSMRRHRAIRLEDLARLRVSLKKSAPFLSTADPTPAGGTLDSVHLPRIVQAPMQLSLFEAKLAAGSGQL